MEDGGRCWSMVRELDDDDGYAYEWSYLGFCVSY